MPQMPQKAPYMRVRVRPWTLNTYLKMFSAFKATKSML